MKTNLKPVTPKARALFKKLKALAEQGIGGEKSSAQKKLARLTARFDFNAPDLVEMPDLFSGKFSHSATARRIGSFAKHDFDVANSVKWAIESATRIPCIYRNGDLLAEATPSTANRLAEIATHIAESFRALLGQFGAVDGVNGKDRGVFVMGLYDGMMNDARSAGQRLPNRGGAVKLRKPRKNSVAPAANLHVHPYTVGLSLGKQIRFSAPLAQITAELEATLRKHLPQPPVSQPGVAHPENRP
ncbi:MAG TPA: hypothetical protein VL970_11510 [Candidatus Acidoferrales bacterium]|nr:hypothetical protein [Candidatus Acidoferrales bacterium]